MLVVTMTALVVMQERALLDGQTRIAEANMACG